MKHNYLSIFLISALLLTFAACATDDSSSDDTTSSSTTATTDSSTTSTVSGANSNGTTSGSASATELEVITEMNYARTKPQDYVTARLQPLVASASGTYRTALEECISEMNAMSALSAYTAADGLYKCAAEWVAQQGATEATGHDSNLSARFSKYCKWSSWGENCSYGYDTPQKIVIGLLIDDGVEGRGHRKNILSATFTHAGASIGSHAKYTTMCCIDFASGYEEK